MSLHMLPREHTQRSHLHYAFVTIPQHQAAVKFYGVFSSHWMTPAYAQDKLFHWDSVRDSGDLVKPFMQADN